MASASDSTSTRSSGARRRSASPSSCSGTGRPSRVNSAKRTGITNGWRSHRRRDALRRGEVLRQRERDRRRRRLAVRAVSLGVPDCEYQRLNASSCTLSGLTGLTSAMDCANASQVTAWPSWRLKYSVMPRSKPARPTSVCIMRTSSEPFS